jgi:hypothetical protein
MKLIGSALVLAFVLMSQGAAQTAKTASSTILTRWSDSRCNEPILRATWR